VELIHRAAFCHFRQSLKKRQLHFIFAPFPLAKIIEYFLKLMKMMASLTLRGVAIKILSLGQHNSLTSSMLAFTLNCYENLEIIFLCLGAPYLKITICR
jgi:hypothetical protein